MLRANLVELNGMADESFDHAVCLFSTLGMIEGRSNRAQFLSHSRRLIRPGGQLVLHAHATWQQILVPGGFSKMASNLWRSFRGREEFGDRRANYRSIRDMFIHSFRRGELMRQLTDAGFTDIQWHAILRTGEGALTCRQQSRDNPLKTVGWIVVCKS